MHDADCIKHLQWKSMRKFSSNANKYYIYTVISPFNILFIAYILLLQALKVLRTAEFLPYVVFIEAPNFEVLKDMNRSAIEAGVVTKQMTVIPFFKVFCITAVDVG